MILLIDNYDSFTYNLAHCLGSLGKKVEVRRNDGITMEGIRKMAPERIVLSPGPGHPENPRDFGVCGPILAGIRGIPILGVCLGHQGIVLEFGGNVVRNRPMHGKVSMVSHSGSGIFKGVKNPLRAMRYHSLVGVDIPGCLEVVARSDDDLQVMAVQHREYPIFGLQFHPESIMTEDGMVLLGNFLEV